MAPIRDAFKAGSTDLFDLRADPSTIIKIQGLVKGMLEANANRQMGIAAELQEEYGAFALPGVISATYVLQDQVRNHKQKLMLAELLVTLSEANPAAHRLILNAGIVECPFEISREIAAMALELMNNFQVVQEEQKRLLSELDELVRIEERSAVLALFQILLRAGIGYEKGLEICRRWFEGEYEAKTPSRLMALLLKHMPDKTRQTLDVLLRSLDRQDKEAGQIIKDTVELSGPEAVIPAMEAASRRLDTERVQRAKPVEHLFEGAIARQIMDHPEMMARWGEVALKNGSGEGINRYWWQAVAEAIKKGCLPARAYVEDVLRQGEGEGIQEWCVVQLLFLEKAPRAIGDTKTWAKQMLSDLRQNDPDIVGQAEFKHEQIVGGSSSTYRKDRKDPTVTDIR